MTTVETLRRMVSEKHFEAAKGRATGSPLQAKGLDDDAAALDHAARAWEIVERLAKANSHLPLGGQVHRLIEDARRWREDTEGV